MKIPSFKINFKKPDFKKIAAPFLFYKTILAWVSKFRAFPFFWYVLTLILSLLLLKATHFGHPIPDVLFFPSMLFQFFFGFVPNLFYRRTGRIFTAAASLLLVRVSAIGLGADFVTLGGLFTGAIAGIFVRDFIAWIVPVETAKETDPIRRISALNRPSIQSIRFLDSLNAGIIVFLFALVIERMIVYFNAPFVKGIGILETMYLPGLSSREAFGLSIDMLAGLGFPMVYLLLEERVSPETNKPYNHWLMGLVAGFVINLGLMFLQGRYAISFFANGTNLAQEAGRLTGFFRDSGSSSWIMATLIVFFILLVLYKKGVWRNYSRWLIVIFLIVSGLLLGLKQGRTFYFIFIPSLVVLFSIHIYKIIHRKYMRILFLVLIVSIVPLFVFLVYWKGANHKSATIQTFHRNLVALKSNQIGWREKIAAIDKNRYLLNTAAIDFFMDRPLFGNGPGSFIVRMKEMDPYFKKYPLGILDGPASFYTGILHDIGILGALSVVLWLIIQLMYRKNITHATLLILPFATGYQITHPDGAVIAIFLITLAGSKIRDTKWVRFGNIFLIGMSALFVVHSLYDVNLEPRGPAFRKHKTGKYQLFAAEENKISGGLKYHMFRGRVIFALTGGTVAAPVFLDQTTKADHLKQKWTILDAEFQEIKQIQVTVKKFNLYPVVVYLTPQSKYLMIESLDDKGNPFLFGDSIPYNIPANRFTPINTIF